MIRALRRTLILLTGTLGIAAVTTAPASGPDQPIRVHSPRPAAPLGNRRIRQPAPIHRGVSP